MANPTAQVPSTITGFDDNAVTWPMTIANATTYWHGQMIGVRNDGYGDNMDDTQALTFLGILWMQSLVIDAQVQSFGAGNAAVYAKVIRPRLFSMPLISGTASRAVDLGKPVYAADAGHVQLTPTGLGFSNLVGTVANVRAQSPGSLTGTEVEIEPIPWSLLKELGGDGTLTAPATGGKVYGREAVNKTIYVPNTAAENLTLPAVANTVPGDRIRFVKTTTNAFSPTLVGNAAETINGANTYVMAPQQWAAVEAQSDGTQWIVDTNSGIFNTLTVSGMTTTGGVTAGAGQAQTKTANYTLVAADSGSYFDNTGAAGSVTFTLPAVGASKGFTAEFFVAADQAVVISAPANTLIGPNNATRTTYTTAAAGQRIGTSIFAYCNGVNWFLFVDVKGLTLGTFA